MITVVSICLKYNIYLRDDDYSQTEYSSCKLFPVGHTLLCIASIIGVRFILDLVKKGSAVKDKKF